MHAQTFRRRAGTLTARRRVIRCLELLALTALTPMACVRAGGSDPHLSGSPDLLTRDEILKAQVSTAYDAIQQLRPAFLRSRGRTSILQPDEQAPVVYLDDRRLGGLSFLRDIPIQMVFEIRYLSAGQAQMRWGSGHPSGAIHVISAREK